MLNTKQAAEKLSVHPATIRRLVASGQLKATILNSVTTRSQLRIDEKVLQAFIDAPQHESEKLSKLAIKLASEIDYGIITSVIGPEETYAEWGGQAGKPPPVYEDGEEEE